MSESAPSMNHDGNPDYIKEHPNAVQDPAMAEEMAHASTTAEMGVVFATSHAEHTLRDAEEPSDQKIAESEKVRFEQANFPGIPLETSVENERHARLRTVAHHIATAVKQRELADSQAENQRVAYMEGRTSAQKLAQAKASVPTTIANLRSGKAA